MRMPGEYLRTLIVRLSNRSSPPECPGKGIKKITALLNLFFPDPRAQEAIFQVLVDYVFNVTTAIAKSSVDGHVAGHPENVCRQCLIQTFRLDEGLENDLARAAMAVAWEARRPRGGYSSSKLLNDDYCYLCGADFDTGDEESTTVDHVWPKRAGGTGQGRNMFRTHDRCEAPKWDLVGAGDVESCRFAFREGDPVLDLLKVSPQDDWWETPLDSKDDVLRFLRKLRMARLRISVAARQQYNCEQCRRSFLGEVRGFRVVRFESRLPWTLTNTVAICFDCYESGAQHGERLQRSSSPAT